jgi:hypothetical protein
LVALRTLLRHRAHLIEHRAPHVLHMQKALLQMNIQLSQALSDVTGVTGQRIIRAIVAGERDPRTLAALRNYRCKKDEDEIALALTGRGARSISLSSRKPSPSSISTPPRSVNATRRSPAPSPSSGHVSRLSARSSRLPLLPHRCSANPTHTVRTPRAATPVPTSSALLAWTSWPYTASAIPSRRLSSPRLAPI